ncbi:MAG: hypothetical protein ABIQ01_13345 [Pseudolysinimonas sp.]
MTPARRPRASRAGLHVLWALPLALIIGYPLWFAARLGWCGFGGCWGSDANNPQFGFGLGVGLAIICSGLVFASIVIPPWIRPWWVRAIVAVVVACLAAYIFGWGDAPAPIPFLPTVGFGGIIF